MNLYKKNNYSKLLLTITSLILLQTSKFTNTMQQQACASNAAQQERTLDQDWQALHDLSAAVESQDANKIQQMLAGPNGHLLGSALRNFNEIALTRSVDPQNELKLIHHAAKNGITELVKELIKTDPRAIYSKDKTGALPIHYAAAYNQVDTLNILLEKDYYLLNAEDDSKTQPIHLAVKHGHEAILDKLINLAELSGTVSLTLSAKTEKDLQPIHLAIQNGRRNIVNKLISKKPDLIRSKNKAGIQPIHIASGTGEMMILNDLLTIDKNLITAEDKDKKQPIHYAVGFGKKAVIDFLFRVEPQIITAKDKYNKKPINYARSQDIKDTVELFQQERRSQLEKELAQVLKLKEAQEELKQKRMLNTFVEAAESEQQKEELLTKEAKQILEEEKKRSSESMESGRKALESAANLLLEIDRLSGSKRPAASIN